MRDEKGKGEKEEDCNIPAACVVDIQYSECDTRSWWVVDCEGGEGYLLQFLFNSATVTAEASCSKMALDASIH